MNDWGPELCNLLWGSFWVKAAFVPWEESGPGLPLHPAPPGPAATCRRREPPPGRGAGPGSPGGAQGRRAPFPARRTPARGPLTDRAETGLRLSSVAPEVTPSSGLGSRSYSVRTRPTSGWRLSPSSCLFLGPRDRKIVRGEAHRNPKLGPLGASPGGGEGGLHPTPACSPGIGRSHSPGTGSPSPPGTVPPRSCPEEWELPDPPRLRCPRASALQPGVAPRVNCTSHCGAHAEPVAGKVESHIIALLRVKIYSPRVPSGSTSLWWKTEFLSLRGAFGDRS